MLLNCVGEDSWESLDCKEIKPVHPKENQSWVFGRRTDAEAEAPILWPPDSKSRLIRKGYDAGQDWRQEEKGVTEDEMVGWHHWLNGHESEQALGHSEGQGSLACCSPWGCKKSDMTEWLNSNNLLENLQSSFFFRGFAFYIYFQKLTVSVFPHSGWLRVVILTVRCLTSPYSCLHYAWFLVSAPSSKSQSLDWTKKEDTNYETLVT